MSLARAGRRRLPGDRGRLRYPLGAEGGTQRNQLPVSTKPSGDTACRAPFVKCGLAARSIRRDCAAPLNAGVHHLPRDAASAPLWRDGHIPDHPTAPERTQLAHGDIAYDLAIFQPHVTRHEALSRRGEPIHPAEQCTHPAHLAHVSTAAGIHVVGKGVLDQRRDANQIAHGVDRAQSAGSRRVGSGVSDH
jgi:hypothetical protein